MATAAQIRQIALALEEQDWRTLSRITDNRSWLERFYLLVDENDGFTVGNPYHPDETAYRSWMEWRQESGYFSKPTV